MMGKNNIQEDMLRHIVLNSLRSFNKQFKTKYGSLVLCCDNRKYWRRDVFPFYKANRKRDRDASDVDWNSIFGMFNTIKSELRDNFPYRMIDVTGAEADDVVATLVKTYSDSESILILSSDRDFCQLHKHKNVTQYSPILKRFISADHPELYVKEQIIRGDRGDGIPNILSLDNTFVVGERQKTISSKKMNIWLNQEPKDFCSTDLMLRGFTRNQMLIDLDFIPENIKSNIIEAYDSYKPNPKTKMLNFLIEKRLKALTEVCDEF